MHDSDRLCFTKFSITSDHDSFFLEDDFQDLELEGGINELLDATGIDETDDFFWDQE